MCSDLRDGVFERVAPSTFALRVPGSCGGCEQCGYCRARRRARRHAPMAAAELLQPPAQKPSAARRREAREVTPEPTAAPPPAATVAAAAVPSPALPRRKRSAVANHVTPEDIVVTGSDEDTSAVRVALAVHLLRRWLDTASSL